ncbi:PA2928 family protein [Heyndrickxia sp. FSL K6-6286]|uniref:PA2928 family protein n=1 Tax=Heyndrickxia sp. FSL K6-6286 TaxID=2921510 RepID=UPI00315B3AA9
MFFVNLFKGWFLRGWFFFDLVVGILYFILLILISFWLYRMIKNKLAGKGSFRRGFSVLGIMLIIYFMIGCFVLLIFNGAGRHVDVKAESPTLTIQKNGKSLVVNKVSVKVPNGQSNGISTSVSSFEFIAVNSDTGKKEWTKKSNWQDYVLGQTNNEMIVINPKKKKLSFIDLLTGKETMTEKELYQKVPELKGNLSYEFTDYFIDKKEDMYIYGLDNHYYKLDLQNYTLKEDDSYKKIVNDHTFDHSFFQKGSLPVFSANENDQKELMNTLNEINTHFINPSILAYDSKESIAYISYQTKRNEQSLTLSKVNLQSKKVNWSTTVETNNEIMGYIEDNDLFIQSAGNLYRISLKDGKLHFKYEYLWNKSV